ncbi:MAG: protein tyrosine phosphatase family protein [Novosphingobium sp.]|nr:protein tyrosine phosphatase family protein [Novosphingobium sp.]
MASDPSEIEAWQRLDERTTTSGFLTPDDIAKLAAIGVCHVINLAPDGRDGALEGEAELLAQRAIRYSYIPVPFDAPAQDQFDEFRQAYDGSDEQVHVHCIANYRVSAFFYRYNRDHRDMEEAHARSLMEQQWSPETWDHELGKVWAQFIAKGAS